MSRVLPILFNTDMVLAILDGRKTVTRRKIPIDIVNYCDIDTDGTLLSYENDCGDFIEPKKLCQYQPGDTMYVRETWRVGAWDIRNQMIAFDYKDGTCGELIYIHDRELFERLVNQSREDARKAKCEYNGVDFIWEKGKSPCRWHPSIHMPKKADRIFLKVKDVRVERLQEITAEDALAEGAERYIHLDGSLDESGTLTSFIGIWNSTIKKSDLDRYGWDASPWVWVIEFERYEKPENM